LRLLADFVGSDDEDDDRSGLENMEQHVFGCAESAGWGIDCGDG
jgi:hypothetical protein